MHVIKTASICQKCISANADEKLWNICNCIQIPNYNEEYGGKTRGNFEEINSKAWQKEFKFIFHSILPVMCLALLSLHLSPFH